MSSKDLQKAWDSAYLSGANMAYVDALYEDYIANPDSVPKDWKMTFQKLTEEGVVPDVSHRAVRNYFLNHTTASQVVTQNDKQSNVLDLMNAYRAQGHLVANLDPLNMIKQPDVETLRLSYHGLSDTDLSRSFQVSWAGQVSSMQLQEVFSKLKTTYCGTIGIEYMHVNSTQEKQWFQSRFESSCGRGVYSAQEKRRILKDLIVADGLERYLGTRYVGQKRFSLEGGDSLIPMMKEMIRVAGYSAVKEIPVGMAHRGRLNVLVNVLGKEPLTLFQEFEGKAKQEGTGDVKYHLGFASDLRTESGEIVHVALGFNPSHLEIIGPVVEGSARSRLRRRQDLVEKNAVMPIVIHGDAAFAGQGVVMETFNFSQVRGYCTGGTVHIVINNQIGFTTSNPLDARSTLYCTDVAKMVHAPIIHVNGEDPEAVVFAAKLAVEYRMQFKRDIVIDLVCYRRHGHNEADEPSITQPLMYQKIKTMLPLREIYANELIQHGVISQEEVEQQINDYRDALDQGKDVVDIVREDYPGKLYTDWSPYLSATWDMPVNTAVDLDTLTALSKQLMDCAFKVELHPVVKKIIQDREKMTASEMPMNWGYAETMAYATLLHEGHSVRLSGQDCGRGTFAHRHAVLHDQKTGEAIIPLDRVVKDPNKPFSVIDSVLSEEAVLAFEYGYACSEPTSLVLWEGQFGDFANGAQVVIDQFISSGEQKWGRLCGLVMLLPHGYEGQGPEHSSARLERYMQLCAQQNIQVCVPTTPAQMFHLLRRQILRPFRKPLIVMTPKSLLRHRLAVSSMTDLTTGQFYPILSEVDELDKASVKKLVLCSGKVYYDLLEKRRQAGLSHVAILRVEQLYPFPEERLKEELSKYPLVTSVIWCQEEPENQGAWFASQHHIRACLGVQQTLSYAGRGFAASPAVGSANVHAKEQQALVEQALLSD
jgi:2-oxoglutarate dehydrogenase E1 component